MTYRTMLRLLEAQEVDGMISKRYTNDLLNWMNTILYEYVYRGGLKISSLEKFDKTFVNKVLKPELGKDYADFLFETMDIMDNMYHNYGHHSNFKMQLDWIDNYLEDTRTDWHQKWLESFFYAVAGVEGRDYWDEMYG